MAAGGQVRRNSAKPPSSEGLGQARLSRPAAELLIASARGLESSAASPAAHRRYLDALVRVMVAGLSSTHSSDALSRPQA
jgi:hypothetical protein